MGYCLQKSVAGVVDGPSALRQDYCLRKSVAPIGRVARQVSPGATVKVWPSSTGENAAAKGIMNKIRIAAEIMLANYAQTAGTTSIVYSESPYAFYDMGMFSDPLDHTSVWSLSQYRDEAKQNTEEWDELEKSVVSHIADNVTVSIRNYNVEMMIYKKLS